MPVKSDRARLKTVWADMLRRCENPARPDYKWYGAKGISVCPEWHDFDAFLAWAISSGHDQSLSLDRIDPSAGYNPQNCRWATMKTQQRNRSNNHLLTFAGKTQCISAWAEETGIGNITIWNRVKLRGWSVERALTVRPCT